jgi:hypothetical protein
MSGNKNRALSNNRYKSRPKSKKSCVKRNMKWNSKSKRCNKSSNKYLGKSHKKYLGIGTSTTRRRAI